MPTAALLAFAASFFMLFAWLDLAALPPGTVPVTWTAPAGITMLSVVVLRDLPTHRWAFPMVLAGTFTTVLLSALLGARMPLATAAAVALWDVLVGAGVALLYRRFVGRQPRMSRPWHVAAFMLCALIAVPMAFTGLLPGTDLLNPSVTQFWWGLVAAHHIFMSCAGLMVLAWFPQNWRTTIRRDLTVFVISMPSIVALVWLMARYPDLELSWLILLPTLWAGMTASTGWIGLSALSGSLFVALVPHWVNLSQSFGGPMPGFVQSDLLASASVFIAVVFTLYRARLSELHTHLKAERAAAAEQADVVAGVFQSMSDAVFVLDAHRDVVVANAEAFRLFGGIRPGPITAWRLDGQLQAEDGTWTGLEGLLAAGAGDSTVHPAVYDRPGAPRRHLDVEIVQIGADAARRTLLVLTDSTQTRLYQEELRSFAGVVAHDLKAPLTSLQGWLEVLDDEEAKRLQPVGRQALAAARRGGTQLRDMIDDWLGVTVAENTEPRAVQVRLDSLVAPIAGVLSTPTGTRPALVVDAPDPVLADPVMMRQVLANLLGNATKYADPARDTEIDVRTRPVDGGRVEVIVRDNGIGIPPGEENRIFDAGHRAAAHAGEYAGTGRGLALCSRVVQRHGGRISVSNNTDGPGATFRFTLPAAA